MSKLLRPVYCSLRGIPELGIVGSLKFLLSSFSDRLVHVSPRSIGQPLKIRGKTSDVETFFEIIIRGSYPLLERDLEVIVDAGANAGYSTAFFASRYPNATVYALEPEIENYELLVENTAKLPNVIAMNAALWSSATELFLQNEDAEPWAYQFASDKKSGEKVSAHSVSSLMKEHEISHIDLLKLDIEGAERELFSENTEWLDSVKTIIVEIHDFIVPGCGTSVFNTMTRYNYDFYANGEHVVLENIRPRSNFSC